jgi:DDE family transposase
LLAKAPGDLAVQRLLAVADAAGSVEWSVSVDPTIARAHQHATNITRHSEGLGRTTRICWASRLTTAVGRSRGGPTTKIHQLVDGRGWPLVMLVSAGPAGDAPMFLPLTRLLQVPRIGRGRARTRPERVRGDKAYSPRAIRTDLRSRRIIAVIPEPAYRARRGSRDGRPPAFDTAD